MSENKKQPTPHDAFFKRSLKNSHTAKHLLTHYLPETTLAILDLDTLEMQNVEFIDKDLEKSACDVVFRVKTKKAKMAYIYTLIEHQRVPEKRMPFRLLKYMIRLMDDHLTRYKTDILPLVIPLAIYNGERAYPYSMDIFDLFHEDQRRDARNSFFNPCSLVDLSQENVESFNSDWLDLFFKTLKYGPSSTQMRQVVNILEIAIIKLAGRQEFDVIENAFRYLYEVQEKQQREALWEAFQACLQPKLGEKFMISIADELRQEGMHIKEMQIARNFLDSGFDVEVVAQNTGLDIALLQKLKEEVMH